MITIKEGESLIFDIYRGTTHDGPGLRSTVFFKGCPLRCDWCHNPEGQSNSQEIWWNSHRCIGCGSCIKVCTQNVLQVNETGITIDKKKCKSCLRCTKECPTKALMPIGTNWNMDELFYELKKDKMYYEQTGGGVTASGGEAMLQWPFVKRLFEKLKCEGISTALDTCGLVPYTTFEEVLPFVDYLLYDIKILNEQLHKQYTGKQNDLILHNLLKIVEGIRDGLYSCKLWIRTPLIPRATATVENITAISNFIVENFQDCLELWELCAFNNACITKYKRLGKEWLYSNEKLISKVQGDELKACAINAGINKDCVFVTGLLSGSS